MDSGISPEDERLSEIMKKIAVQCAATGNPNCPDLGVSWPPYLPKEDIYLRIDIHPEIKVGFSTWTPEEKHA